MEPRPVAYRIQFRLSDLMWATFWLGACFALFQMSQHPEHRCSGLAPLTFSLISVPAAGFVGTLGRRPIYGAIVGAVVWLALMVLFAPAIQSARE